MSPAPALSIVPTVEFDRFRLKSFVDGLDAGELERRAGASKLSEIARALEANP